METSCNQALIIGELVTEPEWRTLPGGTQLFSFGLTVQRADAAATSVPLVWYDPPQRVKRWRIGTNIAARGSVVRRFYQARGMTASRTEVTVEHAECLDHAAKSRRLVERSVGAIKAMLVESEPSSD